MYYHFIKTMYLFSGLSSRLSKRKRNAYDFDKFPERELFYWALLFNRREFAKMFWKGGQDQLGVLSD